jgi:hypothetical protein
VRVIADLNREFVRGTLRDEPPTGKFLGGPG